MPLFEVAIVQRPTKKELDEGTGVETLVFGPKAVIARDGQSAAISAVMDGGVKDGVDRTRMDVLVRPFA
jgi:hypothetical protein